MNETARRDDAARAEYLRGVEAVQYWELLDVVRLFNRSRVPLMLMKGAAELAAPDYGPPGHRPRAMGDIDVYVPAADAGKAVRILEAADYVRVGAPEETARSFEFMGQIRFQRKTSPVYLDVHFQLHKFAHTRRLIDTDRIWNGRVPVRFDGGRAYVPSREENLWFQFVHFFYFHEYSTEEMLGEEGKLWYLVDLVHHYRNRVDVKPLLEKAIRENTGVCFRFLLYCVYKRHGVLLADDCFGADAREVIRFWIWLDWVRRLPPLLTHAAGRFTVLTLFRRNSFAAVVRTFYDETNRFFPRGELLKKYRVEKIPALYPFLKYVHALRLTILHAMFALLHMYFRLRHRKRIESETRGMRGICA